MSSADLNGVQTAVSQLPGLISRMHTGDREAVADFVTSYRSKIRRRIRGKLYHGARMRRLFDSDEIFSTIARRLDRYVSRGNMAALTENELWGLIGRMTDRAVIDKSRVFRRLEETEGPDSQLSHIMLLRLREAELRQRDGAEIEVEKAVHALSDSLDRKILLCWLEGKTPRSIASEVGISEMQERKRWQRIRNHLRVLFKQGLLE